MGYTPTPLDTSTPPLPMAAGVPFGGNTTTPTEMGPINANSGNPVAPVSMYVKDGNNLVEGATTDAAVVGDNSGSLSAKLRGLTKILNAVWDSVNNRLSVNVIAAQGVVAPWGSNPANTGTANTDAAFKWGGSGTTQVNHLMIQNNSTADILWELDAASTSGSAHLGSSPPGNTLFLDIQTSALHVQTSVASVAFNAASGIVVKAWL